MGLLAFITICTHAPELPAVPFVVTPVVYSEPLLWVPSLVVENLRGWLLFEALDKSNL